MTLAALVLLSLVVLAPTAGSEEMTYEQAGQRLFLRDLSN